MILIKEITVENCMQFRNMAANVLVVEHKQGDEKMRHSFYLVGILVCEIIGGRWHFQIKFSDGNTSGIYYSVLELIKREAKYFSFYYIEIKKQQ